MMISSEQLIERIDNAAVPTSSAYLEGEESQQKAFDDGYITGLKKARFLLLQLVEPLSQNEKPFLLINDKEMAMILMCDEELFKMVLEMDTDSIESEDDLNFVLLFKIYKKMKKVLKKGIRRVKPV